MPGQARAALFDLDGTLLDTAPDLAAALDLLLVEEGREPLPLATVRPHVSNGAIAVVHTGFPEIERSTAQFEALRQRFLVHYGAALAVHTKLFPGFDSVLATLESQSIPWGIITNKAAWLTEPLLDALGLLARAACVVSGDTLAVRKPHPEPLLLAAARIGIPAADCVYVGDALRDVQAALAAGMVPLGARYGYLNASEAPDTWPVAGWIEHPRDLLPWMQLEREAVH
ncbi:MAG: phosphoglycolate phosphatase [Steroidobacteraceae bacterium]